MDMKRMMQQAKAIQKQIDEKLTKFDETKFEYDYKNSIKITIYGNLKVEKIEILDALIDKDDKIILQEMIAEAITEANQDLLSEREQISKSFN
ncbi:YbaB/EbfC family nucleoid-associated protein [bacterium]|nr:YbaB/EbfC family nucleoid-associated protein [bacterium]